MITHHPGEELVAAYAAGTLDEASSLAIATHLTLCPSCRHVFLEFEALGAALVDEMAVVPMAQDAFAATMARARAPGGEQRLDRPAPLARQRQSAVLPLPLQNYVGGDLAAAKWRPLGPGIHHMPLISADGVTARLLRIAPGKSVFAHSHGGSELTLVLKGSYEAGGARFARGDLEMADDSVNHRPVAGIEDVCVCLAVTDAPLRFENWLGRLMQPFIGI